MVINQIKGNFKDDMRCQHIVRKYHEKIYFRVPLNTFLDYLLLQRMSFFYLRHGFFKLDIIQSIQIFNLSIQVSLSLMLIVHVTLELIYGTLFSSVLPMYVTSQPTLVANTWKSLLTDERIRKDISVANPIRHKCLKFASRFLESSLTICVKYTYRNLRTNLDLLQKTSCCA